MGERTRFCLRGRRRIPAGLAPGRYRWCGRWHPRQPNPRSDRLTQLGLAPGERQRASDSSTRYRAELSDGRHFWGESWRPRQPLPLLAGADRMRVRVSLDFGGEGHFPLADEMAPVLLAAALLPRAGGHALHQRGLVSGQGGASPSSTIRTAAAAGLSGDHAGAAAPDRRDDRAAPRRWRLVIGPCAGSLRTDLFSPPTCSLISLIHAGTAGS